MAKAIGTENMIPILASNIFPEVAEAGKATKTIIPVASNNSFTKVVEATKNIKSTSLSNSLPEVAEATEDMILQASLSSPERNNTPAEQVSTLSDVSMENVEQERSNDLNELVI